MERENKNLLLYFVELGARKGILKTELQKKRKSYLKYYQKLKRF